MADLLEKLEAAWGRGEPPNLVQWVNETEELPVSNLAVLVSEDFRYRRQSGQDCQVESYFQTFPQLQEESAAVDLIYVEYLLREESGETPTEQEYAERFPDHEEAIRRQLQLHQLLMVQSAAGDLATEPATVPNASSPTIEGFDVLEIVGHGAMGVVYKARDLKLNRVVAIKMLLTGQHASEKEKRQFQREAEAAARLQHRHVVSVYQVGITSDGIPFLVMEYIKGGSLLEVLQVGPLPIDESVSIARDVVVALACAHGSNIVHQDIKPGNILIAPDGPQIADFGLSRPIDSTLTQLSMDSVAGTPQYMAPEQADPDAAIGPACDIYAVGAILYEMLSGRPPLHGASPWEVFQQLTSHDPPRLRELNPSLPRDLETICEKCLQKIPSRRYASAVELGEDLRRFAEGHPISARPVSTFERCVRWCRRQPKLAAAAGLASLLAIAITVVTTMAATRISDARSETESVKVKATESRVQSLLNAAPDAIPFCIEALGDEPIVQQMLTEHLNDSASDVASRFRAACGLAARGDVRVEELLTCLEEMPPSRGVCRAAVTALGSEFEGAERAITERTRSVDVSRRVRLAWVSLFLGVAEPAEDLVQRAKDPMPRTLFVHALSDWLAEDAMVSKVLSADLSDQLRAAICLALGTVDSATLSSTSRTKVLQVLRAWWTESDSAAVHSSAQWAMMKWGGSVGSQSANSVNGEWSTNSVGFTMVRLEPGTFTMGSDQERRGHPRREVTLNTPFWISAEEVSAERFREFVTARSSTVAELETWTLDTEISPTLKHPANRVTWTMAIQFCNWLSESEKLQPCYTRSETADDDGQAVFRWTIDSDADGYRLPTEAEWEYAARAGADTRYNFGDEQRFHTHYVRTSAFRKVNAFPCGTLMPNANGLFDTEGNVWDLVWDEWVVGTTEAVADSLEFDATAKEGSTRTIRGGGVDCSSGDADLEARGLIPTGRQWWNVGFRVARNAAALTE